DRDGSDAAVLRWRRRQRQHDEALSMSRFLFPVLGSLLLAGGWSRADELSPRYREVVRKGLEYLATQQHRDGHWEGAGGQFPTTMTSLAGMAMLMEGSTLREGKYADKIRKAVDWLMDRS